MPKPGPRTVKTLNLYEAKTRLSRRPGGAKGRIWVGADFDAALPPDLVAAFMGGGKR